MSSIPVNAVTMKGWPKVFARARHLRIRQEIDDDQDTFYIMLEMNDGAIRYLIDNDDEVRPFDTRKLCAFLRKHTDVKSFDFRVKRRK